MAELDSRLSALEDEFKLLKGEIKQTLVDVRSMVMAAETPISEQFLVRQAAAPVAAAVSDSRGEGSYRDSGASRRDSGGEGPGPWNNPQGGGMPNFGNQMPSMGAMPPYGGQVFQPPIVIAGGGAPAPVQASAPVPAPAPPPPPEAPPPAYQNQVERGSRRAPPPPQVTGPARQASRDRYPVGRDDESWTLDDSEVDEGAPMVVAREARPPVSRPGPAPSVRRRPSTRRQPEHGYESLRPIAARRPRSGHIRRVAMRRERRAYEAPERAELELVMNVNDMSSLMRWVSLARQRMGVEKLLAFVDLYVRYTDHSPHLNDLVEHISDLLAEVPSDGADGQQTYERDTATEWGDLMLQLHGIVARDQSDLELPPAERRRGLRVHLPPALRGGDSYFFWALGRISRQRLFSCGRNALAWEGSAPLERACPVTAPRRSGPCLLLPVHRGRLSH